MLERLEALRGPALGMRLVPEGIDRLCEHVRAVQAEEAWATLGEWVSTVQPRFGPGIGERFAAARAIDPAEAARGRAFRRDLQARVRPLLAGGAILVYPTSPCPAPRLTAGAAEQDAVRQATLGVTAIAGLCGLPEVTLPAGRVDGAPVGLSLVAAQATTARCSRLPSRPPPCWGCRPDAGRRSPRRLESKARGRRPPGLAHRASKLSARGTDRASRDRRSHADLPCH